MNMVAGFQFMNMAAVFFPFFFFFFLPVLRLYAARGVMTDFNVFTLHNLTRLYALCFLHFCFALPP